MARYRNNRYHSYRRRSIGHERAMQHIQEAEDLSRELGGTDEDVKKYFFSLSAIRLKTIFDKYEKQHGNIARVYAEETLPKWRNGKVHMSGMVAERLFNLLPPTMPLETKFQLIDSLWQHVGPSSTKVYYIGLGADLEDVMVRVKEHLEEVVIKYNIPNSMESRFNWLSQGDVGIKQQLLNYFRQQEKRLLSKALQTQLPVLMNHLNSEKGILTTHVEQALKVGKHEVRVVFSELVNGISETAPVNPAEKSNYSWIWGILGIIIVLWLLDLYAKSR